SKLQVADLEAWLARLEREHDNFRAALGSALETDPEAGLRLTNALWQFWKLRGYWREGRDWLARSRAPGSAAALPLRADTLLQIGRMLWLQGDYHEAISLFEESL